MRKRSAKSQQLIERGILAILRVRPSILRYAAPDGVLGYVGFPSLLAGVKSNLAGKRPLLLS